MSPCNSLLRPALRSAGADSLRISGKSVTETTRTADVGDGQNGDRGRLEFVLLHFQRDLLTQQKSCDSNLPRSSVLTVALPAITRTPATGRRRRSVTVPVIAPAKSSRAASANIAAISSSVGTS